ncbi:nickel-type superoxide dismutase maturation protease [Actinomadura sp. NEAU-AAG7]|uniref:nickel-type superoxide dismutase maturation protease n=1 Tax=Actinomadura sp. NEAU-AAG7 TaxID=2839640 RepID=UPI0027DF9EE8|nr:nickel-type superoxide dismutase maturation protease [Actinomadura sp. NEAU-AAG7]
MPILTRRSAALWALLGAVPFVLLRGRGRLRAVAVEGDSMLPALRPGDWLLVRVGGRVAAGDVVVARHPERPGLLVVKRAAYRADTGWWLESDNQRAPGRSDSWDFGAVPDTLVVGRVVARYWPPSRARRRIDTSGTLGGQPAGMPGRPAQRSQR